MAGRPQPATLGDELDALRPRMIAVARRYAPSREVAEDIVQSACEKAIRHLAGFDGRSRFSTWLHRIVVNEALMWLRAERRRVRRIVSVAAGDLDDVAPADALREHTDDATATLIARERCDRLRRGLAALPAAEREVLEACALGEASYTEFARRTGVRVGAAKSRAFRARQRLRVWLDEA